MAITIKPRVDQWKQLLGSQQGENRKPVPVACDCRKSRRYEERFLPCDGDCRICFR